MSMDKNSDYAAAAEPLTPKKIKQNRYMRRKAARTAKGQGKGKRK